MNPEGPIGDAFQALDPFFRLDMSNNSVSNTEYTIVFKSSMCQKWKARPFFMHKPLCGGGALRALRQKGR